MAQSVELLLDDDADARVRGEWAALADAGLPSEQRPEPSGSHRPHLTLFAADAIAADADAALPDLLRDLDLHLTLGPLLVFGPRRDRCILVHHVSVTPELLALQTAVAERCGADPAGHFGPGGWTPHVTLARRLPTESVGLALRVLGEPSIVARSRSCRRWDGDARRTWSLTT